MLQKLWVRRVLNADTRQQYRYRHPSFTIFEGPNDMLYAEIYDQFVRATAEEKKQALSWTKNQTLLDRLQTDARFTAVARDYTCQKTSAASCRNTP